MPCAGGINEIEPKSHKLPLSGHVSVYTIIALCVFAPESMMTLETRGQFHKQIIRNK